MLETSRLILRQWEAKDRAPFAALNADSDVMRFFPAPLQKAESDNLADPDVIAPESTPRTNPYISI